jgi:hypothetical protein
LLVRPTSLEDGERGFFGGLAKRMVRTTLLIFWLLVFFFAERSIYWEHTPRGPLLPFDLCQKCSRESFQVLDPLVPPYSFQRSFQAHVPHRNRFSPDRLRAELVRGTGGGRRARWGGAALA